jgi:tetratricopeptide (TPR) repeat protein
MSLLASLLFPILLLAPVTDMPGPEPVSYADRDPAASYVSSPPGRRAAYRQMVNAAIQKNPRNSVALSHRAHLFVEGGDPVRAKRDFDAALASAGDDKVYQRSVLWSRGWVNYDLGSTDLALEDWRKAEQLHGGHPSWVTYTYALAYWTMGAAPLALQWFDATVRAMPVWGSDDGFEQKIKRWKPQQQTQMRALFSEWRRRNPIG